MKRDPRRNAIGIGVCLCVERERERERKKKEIRRKKPRPLSRAMKKSDQILRFSSGNVPNNVINVSFVFLSREITGFFAYETYPRAFEIRLFFPCTVSYRRKFFDSHRIEIFEISSLKTWNAFRSLLFRHGAREKDDIPPSRPKTRKRWLGVTRPGNAESRAIDLWDFTRSRGERFPRESFHPLFRQFPSTPRFESRSYASPSFQLIVPSAINFIKLNRQLIKDSRRHRDPRFFHAPFYSPPDPTRMKKILKSR